MEPTFRLLLRTGLDGGYAFMTFDEAPSTRAERACVLRHDVDGDPGAALEIAEIEAEESRSRTR